MPRAKFQGALYRCLALQLPSAAPAYSRQRLCHWHDLHIPSMTDDAKRPDASGARSSPFADPSLRIQVLSKNILRERRASITIRPPSQQAPLPCGIRPAPPYLTHRCNYTHAPLGTRRVHIEFVQELSDLTAASEGQDA
ncbi:hypothetical protein C8Q77DRAFT_510370 [Trametes polyzona]|nr:hypothetical protein C8Q77DRAFT_510370 [Trametes polyzona]